uniref:Cell cycle control protein n=1 Tax=Myripristis murdjan TaxID=586833 RepID=A0A667Z217_9TELE
MAKEKANSGPLARRPDNSAFKQQRLPAWSPMLTANTVLPFFYCMAVLCMLLGVWLLVTVQNTQELKVSDQNGISFTPSLPFPSHHLSWTTQRPGHVMHALQSGNVFFYYGLRNFHQNLRRYMDSRDDAQMVGRKKNLKSPSTYCEPFEKDENGLPIAPCGAVANSIFNDSFTLVYHGSKGSTIHVPLYRSGLTWYTDKNIKYRNPKVDNLTCEYPNAFAGTAKPLYWHKPVYELDPHNPDNNGFINEDLIVWMREAAFPNFKKLYGILNRVSEPFTEGLPVGNYSIEISYNFPVQYFRGRKEVVLTTVTWFGGQNHFLPIAYLVTGGLILLLAVILTVIWWKFGKDGKNMKE